MAWARLGHLFALTYAGPPVAKTEDRSPENIVDQQTDEKRAAVVAFIMGTEKDWRVRGLRERARKPLSRRGGAKLQPATRG